MPGRGVDEPDDVTLIVDEVTHAAAACYLVLPLLEILPIVPVNCQVAT
jgi:hypothetical protein